MDITRSNHLQSQPAHSNPFPPEAAPQTSPGKNHRHEEKRTWLKLSEVILLFTSTALVVALLIGIYQGGPSETKYLDTKDYQAVWLTVGATNGQALYSTYYGHIVSLNNTFLVLRDVYYITTNSSSSSSTSSSNNNIQLIKLGCQQLDAPFDQMIINTDHVAFWENIQSTGQVATAITKYQQQNPNGPNCSQTTSSSAQSSTPTTTNTPATTNSTTSNTTSNTTTP